MRRDYLGLLLLSAQDANTTRLVHLNLATGQQRVLAQDDRYDIDTRYDIARVTQYPDTLEIQMVTYLTDRVKRVVLDPDTEEDISALESLAPGALQIARRRGDVEARFLGPLLVYPVTTAASIS